MSDYAFSFYLLESKININTFKQFLRHFLCLCVAVKEMKKKWRHIRDHFFRILNKGKSGDSAHSRHKKYMYADSLSFLLNWESGRPTSESVVSQEETEEDPLDLYEQTMEDSEETEETEHDGMTATPDAENATAMNQSLQHQLLKYLESVPKVEEEDADRMFILSMLPNFKALTESQKLDFKIMSLQFFKNAKIGQ